MKKITKILTVLILTLSFSLQLSAQKTIQGELIVQITSDGKPNQLKAEFNDIGLNFKKQLSRSLNIWLCTFNESKADSSTALRTVQQHKNVKIAQYNHVVHLNSTTPNDPFYSSQYGMSKIKAPEAWDITTGGNTILGDNIVVAVLDGGFDIEHEDINYWINVNEIPDNGIDDDNNGYIDDVTGWNCYDDNGVITSAVHGTHVAGIVGAIGNNNIGVSGVNWGVDVLPIQASSSDEATVVAGYSYVLEMRELYNQTNGTQGAFIVATNASFSTHGGDVNDYPIWCDIYNALGNVGVLNVNAPWNNGGELGDDFHDIPGECSSQYLIVVSNTNNNDELHNSAPWSKTFIDIVAPGTDIISTIPNNEYDEMTGTSMAAPHVAGAIALIYSAACEEMMLNYQTNPSEVSLTIKEFLLNNSDPVYDLLLKIGYGRLNVYKSIIKMYTQYETDKYLTGNATASEQHAAINSIVVENYTATGDENIDIIAGQSVTLKPGTHLAPTSGGSIHIYTAKNQFDCSIPIQPLTVELIAPENAYCGGYSPITCNAVPTGGLTPYSYVWYSKVITSSSWVVHNNNSPNIAFLSSEDFYVKVELTDDRGVSVMSQTKFIQCIESKNLKIDTIETPGVPIVDITEQNKIENVDYSTYINQEYLRQTFNIYPNPAKNICNISFSLESEQQITITISDIKGNVVNKVFDDKKLNAGEHLFEYNISNFPAGVYLFTISSKDGFNAMKFVKTY